MKNTKRFLQAAGIVVSLACGVLSFVGTIIDEKQLDIKIEEKVREVVGTD